MNFLKNILRMAVVAIATIAVTACENGSDSAGEDSNMKKNPSWSIAYAGAAEINGENHKHTVAVISTDNNPYTVVTVYADEFQTSKLEAFGELLIQDMLDYLKEYNAEYDTSYVLADLLDSGTTMVSLGDPYPGEYISIAIGITPEGELSGLYAASKPFVIEEETPTALYSEWLGNWVFKGDNNQSNNITISRKIANRQIYLTGLMGLPFSIVGEYSVERNDIIFSAQVVEKNYKFSDGREGEIHLLGVDRDGKYYGLAENGNYAIAIAGVIDNGYRAIERYGVNQPGYPKFVAMMLAPYINGKYYSLKGDIPAFNGISELAPADASTSSVAPKQLSVGKKVEVVNF
ncbi:MAG: hypothetical protein E7129_06445 [Rikenellaceae bacterium]|nr:hypothetical protein [Rikenellaceae bacterium]